MLGSDVLVRVPRVRLKVLTLLRARFAALGGRSAFRAVVTALPPTVAASRRFRIVVLAMPPPCYYEQTSVTMVTMLATVASIRLDANGSRSTFVTDRLARMMSNSRMSSSMTDPACLMARFGTAAAPVVPRLVILMAPVTGGFPHRRPPFLC